MVLDIGKTLRKKLWQHTGETLLETLIGLSIIGLVMLCLPMAITATAEMNGKVMEETDRLNLTMTTAGDKDASVQVDCLSDNVTAPDTITCTDGLQPAYPYMITSSTDGNWNQPGGNHLKGFVENGFYYYELTVE